MSIPENPWFLQAEDDLKMAKLAYANGFYSQTCYHASQSAEKALKSIIIDLGELSPKTHGTSIKKGMMRILMNAELSTSYAEWKKAYDDHKWARDEANMKEILVGWCEEDQRIHVCFEVESMEVMQKFMETHAEVIASSGHKQETTVVKILSDA